MIKKILILIITLSLLTSIFSPFTIAFAEDTQVGNSVTHWADKGSDSTSGSSDANQSGSKGGSDAAETSVEYKENENSIGSLEDLLGNLSSGNSIHDSLSLKGNDGVITIENLEWSKDDLMDIKGFKFNLLEKNGYTNSVKSTDFTYNDLENIYGTENLHTLFGDGIDATLNTNKNGNNSNNKEYTSTPDDVELLEEIITGKITKAGNFGLDTGFHQLSDLTGQLIGEFSFDDLQWVEDFPEYNGNLVGADLNEFRDYLLKNGAYIISNPTTVSLGNKEFAVGSGNGLIDFGNYQDRFKYLSEYLDKLDEPKGNGVAIKDTVSIQHIVEYKVENVTENVLYKRRSIPYDDGHTHQWTITVAAGAHAGEEVLSNYGGSEELHFRYTDSGLYHVEAKRQVQTEHVSALRYNMREMWVLADTGQIIYIKTSNGRLGNTYDDTGRQKDKNIVYFNRIIDPIKEVQSCDDFDSVSQSELAGQFPGPGIGVLYTTERLE